MLSLPPKTAIEYFRGAILSKQVGMDKLPINRETWVHYKLLVVTNVRELVTLLEKEILQEIVRCCRYREMYWHQ